MPFKANFGLRVANATTTKPDLDTLINLEIQQAYDAAEADTVLAVKDSGIVLLVNNSGTANAITAQSPQWLRNAGFTPGGWSTFELIPTASNTGPVTINIDGTGPVSVRHEGNAELAPGDLQSGVSYFIRRRGNVYRLMQMGLRAAILEAGSQRTWVTTSGNFAGQTPPADAMTVIQATGNYTALWARFGGPANGVASDNAVQDARGQWWARRLDSRDVNNGRTFVQYTPTPGDKAIPTTASGVITVADGIYNFWAPSPPPPDDTPTPTLMPDLSGRWWRKAEVEIDQTINLDAVFRNQNPDDPVRYVIGRAADGSPLLGFYADGSWDASPFGSIRWPGDDNIVLRTQDGNPLMAFRPDGTLIAKLEVL